MSKTFCRINVKRVQDNKYVKIKYKLNKLTGFDILAHCSITAFLYLMLLQIVTGIPSTVTVLFYKLFYN